MTQPPTTDWVKFPEFVKIVKSLITESTLRMYLAKRETNGVNHFCRKVGRFLFFSPSKFYEWIDKGGANER